MLTSRTRCCFVAALLDGRLLPAGLLDEMNTPGDKKRRYGLGLPSRPSWTKPPAPDNLRGETRMARDVSPLPCLIYSAWGDLPQAPVRPAQSSIDAEINEKWGHENVGVVVDVRTAVRRSY